MSQEAERVYTINLGKVWLSPNNQRAKRAINMIREFAAHHMKTEQIKIDQDLSQTVWKRGIRSPPRKIRVKMAKTDEGYVLVSPYEEEKPKIEEKVEEKPKEVKPKEPEVEEKVEEKIEEKPEKKEKPKTEKKSETKKEAKDEKPKKSETKKEVKSEKKSESKKPKKK
ncbi:MAG TPA: 50S ribosomal protein L31e [Candidatus Nitrosotenuis sp.]|nr:50S ribosomal protein L31e [Candidatus Nitrosotenuis sp.]